MALFGWEKVGREDKNYKACVAATTATGAVVGGATGSVVPVAGTLAGYAGGAFWGFIAGYVACPYLVPAIRKKIEIGATLTNDEVRSAADAMSKYASVNNATDALKLVALVKEQNLSKVTAPVYAHPPSIAKQLLALA